MTPENDFLKNMEMFFNEIEFTDIIKNRVLFYLREYAEKIPKDPPIIITKKIKQIEYRPTQRKYSKNKVNNLNPKNLPFCNNDDLLREANKLCKYYNISYDLFTQSKKGKSTEFITRIRKIFCRNLMKKYLIKNNKLGEFFNVNYSTITYYLYDKPFRRSSNEILKKRKIYAEEKI